MKRHVRILVAFLAATLAACGATPWNNPYPAQEEGSNVLYTAFGERPKHLDPAQSYASNEIAFTAQIYEPPLQYHYLKRPYTLIPASAAAMPSASYYDGSGNKLPESAAAKDIAYTVYEVRIKPGVRYQPHPAFARDAAGKYLYQDLPPAEIARYDTLSDFRHTDTRELEAGDYVYEIKRLAHPRLHSPILGMMGEYIVGLKEYAETLEKVNKQMAGGDEKGAWIDLTRYPLSGVEVVDKYTYRVKIRGKYPQFLYWLAMPFFAPIPPEADRFYAQPGLIEKNITLDWFPVGTGPYMLSVNDPNRQMVLSRNPNFHGETYPAEGEPGDAAAGLLADAGKPIPFIDKVVFSMEKESIPYWNKFLQGYYDASGITSDSFDQAVRIAGQGDARLTEAMEAKGIRLETSVAPTNYYLGFNMLDPVIGGYSDRARKLRQAISIAVDYEEYISIFANGRGIAAQGVIPPGIFGYREGKEGINPYVYDWVNGKPARKSIDEARKLLAEAGYPDGIDTKAGRPLLLYYDVTARGPDDKSRLDWMRKQFQKLNIQLVVRDSDYNRFQDKIRKGNAQIFQWGWNADYPDPENFTFLLYGPNSRVSKEGENSANYANAEYDRLFEQMKNMDNGPERQAIIDRMTETARRDAPWLWGMHPKVFELRHAWVKNSKPNNIANNGLKYQRVDAKLRAERRREWNEPQLWPVGLMAAVLVVSAIPAFVGYRRREKKAAR